MPFFDVSQIRPIREALGTAGQVVSLRDLMRQGQRQDLDYQRAELDLARARRDDDEQMRLRDVLRGAVTRTPEGAVSLDQNKAVSGAYEVNPLTGMALQGQLQSQGVATAAAQRQAEFDRIKLLREKNDFVIKMAGAATDQSSYEAVRKQLDAAGIRTDHLPPVYDQRLRDRLLLMGLDTKDRLDQVWKEKQFDLDERRLGETQAGRQEQSTQRGNQNENTLRDEYLNLTKGFREMRDAYGRIQSLKSSKTGISDTALIYGFAKMLDPLGAVREGDYEAIASSQSYPEQFKTWAYKVANGEKLSDATKAQIMNEVEAMYQQAETDVAGMRGQYRDMAKRIGANPENVIPDFRSSQRAMGGKKMTWADVKTTARSSGKSMAEVMKDAKANGYEVE